MAMPPRFLPRHAAGSHNEGRRRSPWRISLTAPTTMRCIRCYATFVPPPHVMAGRAYCCASCSVGSACEHQGTHRPANVRRYDAMFDRFRQVARYSTPFEEDLVSDGS